MTENPILTPFSAITDEQIQGWKAKYGEINLIEITTADKTVKFVAKKPSRAAVELIGKYGSQKDVAKTNNALIVNCILGGDMDDVEGDGGVYLHLIEQLNSLRGRYSSSLKKL